MSKDWNVYIGNVYNDNVKVLSYFRKKTKRRTVAMFHCLCLRCGTEFDSTAHDVLRKDSRKIMSCGCYAREAQSKVGNKTGPLNIVKAYSKSHQKYKHMTTDGNGITIPIYRSYRCMMARCYYDKDVCYKNYGGRGITVDESIKDFDDYYEFAINNGYRDNYRAHRLDNNIGYTPDNIVFLSEYEHNIITQYMRKNNLTSMTKDEVQEVISSLG